jgi:hypothetical protein
MESLTAIKIITFFYILFNSGRVFSYIPQIIAVFKEQTPVLAISLVTWSFWTAANLTTALYATVVLPDALLAAMSYGNTLGCAIVVFLVVYKRYKYNYWPASKRNQVFETTHVPAFTEVPNIDAEEIYHFFDVADDSDENHTVTFSKKFNHEDIETFDSFLEMTREAKENFISEEPVEPIVFSPIIPVNAGEPEPVEIINQEVKNELPATKKRTRKKKEAVLIQVETKVDDVKQEIQIPVEPVIITPEIVLETPPIVEPEIITEPSSVAILPLEPGVSASKKRSRNQRKKK